MEPSPTVLPPGLDRLARNLGLGELVEQAQAVIDRPLPAGSFDELTAEVRQLRADLQPLMQLARQLQPLLALPKVQRAIAKQQG